MVYPFHVLYYIYRRVRRLGAPHGTIGTGEHIVLPRNAISNVFSGAHGAPLRLGKAQMSYIRRDESSHPTVKCVDKYNSQAPCMVTRQKSCGEQRHM